MTSNSNDRQQSLSILLVSDVHLATDQIPKIRQQLSLSSGGDTTNEAQSNTNNGHDSHLVDVALLAGDMCSLKGEQYTDPEALRDAVQHIASMVRELSRLARRVFWIPGNHDPMSTFDPQSTDSRNIGGVNVHGTVVTVTDGLVLAGFGGSVPAFYDESRHSEQVWTGYPYETEEDFAREFEPFVSRVFSNGDGGAVCDNGDSGDKAQVLLMTHVGPSASSTVNVRRYFENDTDDQGVGEKKLPYFWIHSGSSTIQRAVDQRSVQSRVLLNVHGHTHDSKGVSMLGNVPVLNAGSLREGNWAVIHLDRNDGLESNPWSIRSIQHYHMD